MKKLLSLFCASALICTMFTACNEAEESLVAVEVNIGTDKSDIKNEDQKEEKEISSIYFFLS